MSKIKKIYDNASKSFAVNFLASLELGVACLVLLLILTFWGTLYQADYGLYAAQEKFFKSLVFISMGFLPFPGARLVLWAFAINMLTSLVFRQKYKWQNTGLLLTHYGVVILLVGGFLTFHYSQESQVTLAEGEGTNVSSDYHDWELAVWKEEGSARNITAIDLTAFQPTAPFSEFPLGLTVIPDRIYANCNVSLSGHGPQNPEFINDSGIRSIDEKPASTDPSKNSPAMIFSVQKSGAPLSKLLLYGGERYPTVVEIDGEKYNFWLRRRCYPLPLTIRLIDFRMQKHPGTEMAKSYESTVEIDTGHLKREIVISMNKPLRYDEYTFFQASYMIGENGDEYSTLAVVKNKGRIVPYLATLITGLGLAIHFIIRLVGFMRKQNGRKKKP